MAFRRILAVGDVHGDAARLRALWNEISFDDAQDLLVFLGDYIDRGPAPAEALAFVRMQTERNENVHALIGNHEAMMLAYLAENGIDGFAPTHLWQCNGGDATLRRLAALPRAESEELIRFVKGLPLYFRMSYEGRSILFVHAGIDPAREKQRERDLLWIRDVFFERYAGEELIVVGHTPTQFLGARRDLTRTAPIFFPNNIVACDTGGFLPGGRISCVDVRRYLDLRARGGMPTADEIASCYVQSAAKGAAHTAKNT